MHGESSKDQVMSSLPDALRARDQTLVTPPPRCSRNTPSFDPDKYAPTSGMDGGRPILRWEVL